MLCVRKLREDAVLPSKGTRCSSGFDLTLTHVVERLNSVTVKFGTGLSLKPSEGLYVEIVPRSSIVKTGWMLGNSIGIIDSDYRGELMVCLTKVAPEVNDLILPCKICQLIVRRKEEVVVEEVGELDDTERGEGGFGSTNQPELDSLNTRVDYTSGNNSSTTNFQFDESINNRIREYIGNSSC